MVHGVCSYVLQVTISRVEISSHVEHTPCTLHCNRYAEKTYRCIQRLGVWDEADRMPADASIYEYVQYINMKRGKYEENVAC